MLYLYNGISISKLASHCRIPVVGPYFWKFCLSCEITEDEEELEEQESSTRSRPGLTGPQSWWRREIHQHWWRVNHRTNSSRYFLEPLSFLILFSVSPPSAPCPWSPSGYLISLFFFSVVGAAPIMAGQVPVMRGRAPVIRGRALGGQRSSVDRICGGKVKGSKPLWWLAGGQAPTRVFHGWWPTLA